MATSDCAGARRRFAVACGVLSRCVKAEAAVAAAAAGKIVTSPASSTMLLMPGADVAPDVDGDDDDDDVARRGGGNAVADLPVARKGSLQRFMEKRRDRLGAAAPYSARPSLAPAANDGKKEDGGDARCWLELGIPGSCRIVQ
uniref:Uncharacterized protein n=1 Tax=Leersia perrieri TaxID=77586 RepID=A0A0D9XJA4_9ORYZ